MSVVKIFIMWGEIIINKKKKKKLTLAKPCHAMPCHDASKHRNSKEGYRRKPNLRLVCLNFIKKVANPFVHLRFTAGGAERY